MRRLLSTLAAIGLLWATLGLAKADLLYVTDQGDNVIHRFSTNGTDLGGFSADGNAPVGIAIDKSGNVYVSLYQDNVIRKFSPNGTDLGIFANTGLANPGGMVFDSQGNLLVDNYNYGNLINGIRQGFVREFSPAGADLGLVISPFDTGFFMARDSAGNLYLDDIGAVRGVHKFSPTGADLGMIGGGLFGNSDTIGGMALDANGDLYVADSSANFIRKFSSTGADLGVFASAGLIAPRGLAFGPNGDLFVVNSGLNGMNASIRVFSPTGVDLGNFATTGLTAPNDLAFASSVPEPSTWTLLAIGTVTLLGYARLNRKTTA